MVEVKFKSLLQGLRSIGHCCFDAAVPIHFSRQCIWNTCVHSPQTIVPSQTVSIRFSRPKVGIKVKRRTEWTIISWHLTTRTAAFVWDATNTAHVSLWVFILVRVARVPPPLCHSVPVFHRHFHCSWVGITGVNVEGGRWYVQTGNSQKDSNQQFWELCLALCTRQTASSLCVIIGLFIFHHHQLSSATRL